MTQDEIIEMARQARLHRNQHNLASNPVQYRFTYDGTEEALIAFAKLVAEKERERFIQICNHQADIATDYLDKNLLWQLRDAVRARDNT